MLSPAAYAALFPASSVPPRAGWREWGVSWAGSGLCVSMAAG